MQGSSLPGTDATTLLQRLQPFCRQRHFRPGDVLRAAGQHYVDMYLVTIGDITVVRTDGSTARRYAGSPIGEIGFLRGSAASATCTAATPVAVLVIDDPTMARVEHEQPGLAAELLQHLSATAEERSSIDLVIANRAGDLVRPRSVETYLCRTREMLEGAQRLRYEVYCGELGRTSPFADHERKTIGDDLDTTGWTFVAVEDGAVIGTLRGNKSDLGPLGILEELYGMKASPRHPAATAVCTKFIIKKSRRGGAVTMKLITALVRLGLTEGVRECYIDSIPALLPYYRALGFEVTAPSFFHRENGPSHPMRIDLGRHGERLSREAGVTDYLSLFLKAKTISWLDRLRG